MKKAKKQSDIPIVPPRPGWYVPDAQFQKAAIEGDSRIHPRWVLAVGNDHVIYSVGTKRTKECTLEQFDLWARRWGCRRVTEEKAAS